MWTVSWNPKEFLNYLILFSCSSHLIVTFQFPFQYETEINALSRQLEQMRHRLLSTEDQLAAYESANHNLSLTCRSQMEENSMLKREQTTRDDQMRDLISRLVTVEQELHREQQSLHNRVNTKQRVIDAQGRRITSLDAANARLLSAMDQLKSLPPTAQSPSPVLNGRSGSTVTSQEVAATPPPAETFDNQLATAEPSAGAKQTMC